MKTLAQLFNQVFFRVPDYQRGYAWEESQLEDFWKDLTWLRPGQLHYTGTLTLRPFEKPYVGELSSIGQSTVYHLVDGQQRLTTAYLLLGKLIKRSADGMIGGRQTATVSEQYVAAFINNKRYPIFGYDSPEKVLFLQQLIDEPGTLKPKKQKGEAQVMRNVYERNLMYASSFLDKKVKQLSKEDADRIFGSLTSQLVFDDHVVNNTFDVCAMFESINYRGKN